MVEDSILFIYHHINHRFCHWWLRLRYLRKKFLMVLRGGSWCARQSDQYILVLDEIIWDDMMYLCLSTHGICGKTSFLWLVCWHTILLLAQTDLTNNQTNHCDFESSRLKRWILPTVSTSDLAVGALFHRQSFQILHFHSLEKRHVWQWHSAHHEGQVVFCETKKELWLFVASVA